MVSSKFARALQVLSILSDVLKKNSESKIMTKAEKKILKKCKKFDECVKGSTS